MESLQKSRECLNVKTFKNAVITAEGSKAFLKKLVPAAVSFILHKRINFDKEDFIPISHNGTKYTIFKKRMKNSTLMEITKWLQGVFDALDKNYLRELYVILSDEDQPDHILESYKFHFQYYGENEYPKNASTKDQLRESTRELLEAIDSLNMNMLEFLDKNKTDIKLALTYYQNVTPADYQPPFFGNDEIDGSSLLNAISSHSSCYYQLGLLATGFHRMKCRAKGDVFSREKSFTSVPGAEEGSQALDDGLKALDDEHDDNLSNASVESDTNAVINAQSTLESQNKVPEDDSSIYCNSMNISSNTIDNDPSSADLINCSCKFTIKFDNIDLIQCSVCLTLQHSVCNSYLNAQDVQTTYICRLCKHEDLTPSEAIILEMNSICKLVIGIMHITSEYPQDVLDKVSEDMKQRVVKSLSDMFLIKEFNGNYKPNLDKLRNTYLQKVFSGFIPQLPESINLCDDSDNEMEPPKKRGRKCKRKN